MNTTQQALVTSYLDDLARMLDGVPPAERAEVLAGVREHIDTAFEQRGATSDADLMAVLAELGPPEEVAREAYAGGQYADRPAAGSPAAGSPARAVWSDRPWVPVVVGVLQALGLLVVVLGAGAAVSYTSFQVGDGPRTVDYEMGTALVGAVAAAVLALPCWIGAALLVGNSGLWTTRQKLSHLLLLPVATVVIGIAPEGGWAIAGERGLNIASGAALVVVLLLGVGALVRLTVAGRSAVRR